MGLSHLMGWDEELKSGSLSGSHLSIEDGERVAEKK
jgi:hypothetical protein